MGYFGIKSQLSIFQFQTESVMLDVMLDVSAELFNKHKQMTRQFKMKHEQEQGQEHERANTTRTQHGSERNRGLTIKCTKTRT